jgi:Txe/YoeB family toxin of Txe-Axe toxin-antitoxin module
MFKRAEAKARQSGGKHRGNQHWFDEECIESKWKLREALRVFKENNDEGSRIKYWESRKKYGRTVEKKKATWQMKKAEHIDTLVWHKVVKKIWEAIRNIVKKSNFKNDVKPCNWVKYCDEVYSRKINSGIV